MIIMMGTCRSKRLHAPINTCVFLLGDLVVRNVGYTNNIKLIHQLVHGNHRCHYCNFCYYFVIYHSLERDQPDERPNCPKNSGRLESAESVTVSPQDTSGTLNHFRLFWARVKSHKLIFILMTSNTRPMMAAYHRVGTGADHKKGKYSQDPTT